ncbi:hypothetical protein [Xanthobacter flavus]|uniref:hypothetical protein n=1 Tax=Xanthobacter flavus TaxID=281 RepID=UPI001AE8D097|nr:hypothetical protein [Xanthobacter flavus]MBP2151513.1 chromosome segregation ATPase [Xanthobacter flavus]
MIEQIMYFMLGVLIATLVALLVLPAVWHRAVRLTTKRVEAAVPISIFEVQADKDQQRAFFALNQRRLELQSDAMRDTIVANAATIETQRQRTFELEGELKTLQAQHALLQATSAERDVLLGETQDQLTDRTATVARLEEALADRVAALAALEAAHGTLTGDARAQAEALKAREEALAAARTRITALEADVASLGARLSDTTRRLEETSATLDAERAATLEARAIAAQAATELSTDLTEAQEALALKVAESEARAQAIAALEAERDRLAQSLATAETDLDANRAVVHAFEQRRASEFVAAEAENRRLEDALRMLKADHALMEEAVQRRSADSGPPAPAPLASEIAPANAADNALLRESMADLAARLAALTARMEGDGSPIRQAVADGAAGDLAARIRSLLDQTDAPADEEEAPDADITDADMADAAAESASAGGAVRRNRKSSRSRAAV